MKFLVAGVVLALVGANCTKTPPCKRASLDALETLPRYAVVTSDYSVSSIALLDENASLITEAWLDSGTTSPRVSATLSGDVVFPTVLESGEMTVVDRLGVDVVTRISVPSGEVLGQWNTRWDTLQSEGGYRPNPHDAVAWGDLLIVPRAEPNIDPDLAADSPNRGNDLVAIQVSDGGFEWSVSLSSLDAVEDGVEYFARPDRVVRLGDAILVGLTRASLDYQNVAEGRLARVHLQTHAVDFVVLSGLANCGEIAPIPGREDAIMVVCVGDGYRQWYAEDIRRERAGLAVVKVEETLSLERVWRAADHPEVAPPSGGLIALDDARALVIAAGSLETHDRILLIDFETEAAHALHESDEPFVLGRGVYDQEKARLLIPDASRGILRASWNGEVASSFEDVTDCSPCRSLGAREIRVMPSAF